MLNTLKPFIVALLVPGTFMIMLLLVGVASPNGILGQAHPTACAYEMFTTIELPELSAEWRSKLALAGIQVTDASANGVTEPFVCGQQTSSGYREVSRTEPISGPPAFQAIISVKSTTDAETLGTMVQRVTEATLSIKDAPYPIEESYIDLTVMVDKDQVRVLKFELGTAQQLHSKGLSGADLFNALDKGQ